MQGTESAEAQAIGEARADASGATAYLNLESGDCHGDDSAVRSLLQSGVSRVVIGEPQMSSKSGKWNCSRSCWRSLQQGRRLSDDEGGNTCTGRTH